MDNSMTSKTLQDGKYKIIRTLGQGGFGITYEGLQIGLSRKVAIKEFFMEEHCEREEGSSRVTIVGTKANRVMVERFREKFIKEAQLIAGLENVPHIIRIYDVFEENGTAYYVMQFIEGGSLKGLVKQNGRLDERTATKHITQIAKALSELHKKRIMHLDVKPDNILLKDDEVVLIDFGISKHYDKEGNATTTTPVGRSRGYAPLEQYKQGGVSEFSPETDIYSLGATLYFLLTGENPPEATELLQRPIDIPNYLSVNAKEVITKTMRPNKDERFHSVIDFLKLLQTEDEIERDETSYDNEVKANFEEKVECEYKKSSKIKRILYKILQSIVTGLTVFFAVWTINEFNKLYSNDLELLSVWTFSFLFLSILSFWFEKKVIMMEGRLMCMVILFTISALGSIIDTYYLIGLLNSDIIPEGKINQSLICISLWTFSLILFWGFRKLLQRNNR